MKKSTFLLRCSLPGICCMIFTLFLVACSKEPDERPNILWITFEDTSLFELGIYGNEHVPTPNVAKLAEKGVMFNNVSSLAPHCSPARSSIISGSPATRFGNDWHRCEHLVPEEVYFFPRLMREAGYFCTNNSKTDYNTAKEQWEELGNLVWDECNNSASYNSPFRKEGQPFFSVFNSLISHQGRIATINSSMRTDRKIKPENIVIPQYVPDLPEMRDDFAWHQESILMIDQWLGLILDNLEENGLSENTIIFFYSDHGGPMPQGKEFPYDVGYRVPFVIYVPEKWQHLSPFEPGTQSDRLIDFSDLAPTVLNLAGVKTPAYMDGEPFLGKNAARQKQYQYSFRTNAHTHYDPSRTVFDGRYRYIRNYIPYHPHGIWQWYNAKMPSLTAWTRFWIEGKAKGVEARFFVEKPGEMLFDLQEDPWEVNNLAGLAEYDAKLMELRKANCKKVREIKDLGFFPYFQRFKSDSLSMYDWVRDTHYDVDELISAAEKASEGDLKDIPALIDCLDSEKPELRFWGASGFALIARHHPEITCPEELKKAIHDKAPAVASTAAEALCYLGMAEVAVPAMMRLVEEGQPDVFSSILALIYAHICDEEFRKNMVSYDRVMELVEGNDYHVYGVPRDIYYVAKFIKLLLGEGSWEDYYEEEDIAGSLKTHQTLHERIRTDINFP